MWGEPFAYDEDEGISLFSIGVIVAVFVVLAILGVWQS